MLETGGDPDLALEPVGADGGCQLGVQHLERDRVPVHDVPRQHHARHAAAAEVAVERVAGGEGLLDLRAELGLHGVAATRRWKRGFERSGSKVGSIRSHPGESR